MVTQSIFKVFLHILLILVSYEIFLKEGGIVMLFYYKALWQVGRMLSNFCVYLIFVRICKWNKVSQVLTAQGGTKQLGLATQSIQQQKTNNPFFTLSVLFKVRWMGRHIGLYVVCYYSTSELLLQQCI